MENVTGNSPLCICPFCPMERNDEWPLFEGTTDKRSCCIQRGGCESTILPLPELTPSPRVNNPYNLNTHAISLGPTPSHSVPLGPTPSHSVPLGPTPSHSVPRHLTRSHTISLGPTPSHSVPRHPTPSHSVPHHLTRSHSVPPHPTRSHAIPLGPPARN
jgi:hypothetical protein